MAFAPGCFLWPSFCRSFPWSQLCRISENARWGSPWQIWHSSASRALWEPRFAQHFAQHFAANRGSQSARGAELCQICQGDPQRVFSEILQSCDQGKLLQKEGNKKHPCANAIMCELRFPSSANVANHFAANRGFQSAHEAELCRICQGDPQRSFSEILESCDQGKLLQKQGHKQHPGANPIMS